MCGLCVQLYWPDDKKWYLIEVQSVNPKARTAKCATSHPYCYQS
jgi:hypothetical protein